MPSGSSTSSSDRDDKTLEDYVARFGKIPSQTLKYATLPTFNRYPALAQATRQALKTGKPVQDWMSIVLGSGESSQASPEKSAG